MLRADGWGVNHKRVERIWRQEGLKVPARQPKRGRLWLNDGSCIRLRPAYGNHVWAYDFVFERTREGRPLKFLTVVDEFTRARSTVEKARAAAHEGHEPRRPGDIRFAGSHGSAGNHGSAGRHAQAVLPPKWGSSIGKRSSICAIEP